MKKHLIELVKLLFVTLVLISSGAALLNQITGSQFDPINSILKLQQQNTKEGTPENSGEYSAWQKFKSTIYGAITGKICDKYSAVGAVSTDYTIVGDFRDLAIQGWHFLNNDDVDEIVVTLSASGILLSTVPNVFNSIYLKGFLWNPIVLIGFTKSHFVIHTLKIFKKYSLVGPLVPLVSLFLILSFFPPFISAAIFILSSGYLLLIICRKFKLKKGETNSC